MRIKCKNCGKEFEKIKNRIFCCKKCCTIFHQNKNKIKHVITKKCRWCHNQFFGKKKFCDAVCVANFYKIRKRIFNIFPFESERALKEIQRLEKLGNNYTFPAPHEQLNVFYELKGDNKHE